MGKVYLKTYVFDQSIWPLTLFYDIYFLSNLLLDHRAFNSSVLSLNVLKVKQIYLLKYSCKYLGNISLHDKLFE